jgi:hypothetical protein
MTQKQPLERRKWEEMVTELMEASPKNHVVIKLDDSKPELSSRVQGIYQQFQRMYPKTMRGYSQRINYVANFEEEGPARAFQGMALKAGLDASLHTEATYLEAYEPENLQRRVHQELVNAFG